MVKKKNLSIELLRIIACFLVIMAHIQRGIVQDGIIYAGRLFFSTIIADNVPIFIIITGFFMFSGINCDNDILGSYKKRIKSYILGVYIPALITAVVLWFFSPFLAGECSLTENLTLKFAPSLSSIEGYLFRFETGEQFGHLWYIFTYLKLVIFFPLIAFICQDRPDRNKLRRFLLITAVIMAVIVDIQYITHRKMLNFSEFMLDYSFVYLVLGYELSLFFKKHSNFNIKITLTFFSAYIVSVALKMLLQRLAYQINGLNADPRLTWLECSLCFVSSAGLFGGLFSLNSFLIKNKILEKSIAFVGKRTFFIYLIHLPIIRLTSQLDALFRGLNNDSLTFFSAFLYYLEYGLIVFIISFVLAIVFEWLYNLIIKKFK